MILTGENPFIRLATTDTDNHTTNASFWRIIFSPGGPGHVLYLKSELTENRWRIWTDNIAMARWLQQTVQGMLNAELKDTTIPKDPWGRAFVYRSPGEGGRPYDILSFGADGARLLRRLRLFVGRIGDHVLPVRAALFVAREVERQALEADRLDHDLLAQQR